MIKKLVPLLKNVIFKLSALFTVYFSSLFHWCNQANGNEKFFYTKNVSSVTREKRLFRNFTRSEVYFLFFIRIQYFSVSILCRHNSINNHF